MSTSVGVLLCVTRIEADTWHTVLDTVAWLRRSCPTLPLVLYTDQARTNVPSDVLDAVHSVEVLDNSLRAVYERSDYPDYYHAMMRLEALLASPFAFTLHIDIRAPRDAPLGLMLNADPIFDMIVTLDTDAAPIVNVARAKVAPIHAPPASFPRIGTQVMAYRARALPIIRQWRVDYAVLRIVDTERGAIDAPALRYALWQTMKTARVALADGNQMYEMATVSRGGASGHELCTRDCHGETDTAELQQDKRNPQTAGGL